MNKLIILMDFKHLLEELNIKIIMHQHNIHATIKKQRLPLDGV